MVATATVAIVVSAARSAIASNRDIVEVLNFVGAEERFIARQFELHFLKLGHQGRHCRCGCGGAGLLPDADHRPNISAARPHAEIRRLVGTGRLDIMGYFSLLVVVIIAAICQLTSRYGVRRILDAQNQ